MEVSRPFRPVWSAASLGAVHGLTPREAAVVLARTRGRSVPRIAAAPAPSEGSVRTRLGMCSSEPAPAGRPSCSR